MTARTSTSTRFRVMAFTAPLRLDDSTPPGQIHSFVSRELRMAWRVCIGNLRLWLRKRTRVKRSPRESGTRCTPSGTCMTLQYYNIALKLAAPPQRMRPWCELEGQVSVIHRIKRPSQLGMFEFCALAALRAKQLGRGCLPRVDGKHKVAVTALMEVAAGTVERAEDREIPHPSHPSR